MPYNNTVHKCISSITMFNNMTLNQKYVLVAAGWSSADRIFIYRDDRLGGAITQDFVIT